ncbi:hypothetical protein BJ322DRAFT_428476 [Thelephora terrestris]|uniref:RecA family profile 1 domain-containing protein n=1 Tax=Thelephora terrestris TaxID=56493 RepID=A0A9P6LBF8_9AGAM|nr:hypothetical protein BJ322DRAFT_428476 [Thelephora terrestris]
MRLSSFSPELLPSALVDALRALGIVSDADLFLSATPLEIWRKLPPDLMPFSEFERCVKAVMLRCALPGVVAAQVDERRPASDQFKPETGVGNLDGLLGTTLRDSVVEISGRQGSAATTLALQITCNQLSLHPRATVLWVDTTGDFSPAKANTVLRSTVPHEGTPTALQRLQVALAFDIDSLFEILNSTTYDDVGCLVIDNIAPILGPNLSAVTAEGHAVMTTLVRTLRTISRNHHLTSIITNTSTLMPGGGRNPTSAFSGTTAKPSLGPTFSYLVDATLWLAKASQVLDTDREDLYIAEILKSRKTATGWCFLELIGGAFKNARLELD